MPYCRATYRLEGDGLLVLEVYDEIEALLNFGRSPVLPNVTALAWCSLSMEVL